MGYIGAFCEKDLDECATGLHACKSTSNCINMPGWYYCKCKPGYDTHGTDCHDINECYHGTHSCHPSATCVNSDGHFECQCPDNNTDTCRLSKFIFTFFPALLSIWNLKIRSLIKRTNKHTGCMFEDTEIPDGGRVSPRNQPCKICTCNRGVITCEERPCNCSTWTGGSGRDLCCPQCDPKESCQHQELKHVVFKSGEQWIYQCQTCECLVSSSLGFFPFFFLFFWIMKIKIMI